MRTNKDIAVPYVNTFNKDGTYDKMIKSNPDRTNFYRKPWYLIYEENKRGGKKCEP